METYGNVSGFLVLLVAQTQLLPVVSKFVGPVRQSDISYECPTKTVGVPVLYCRPSPLQTFPTEGLQHCKPSPRKIYYIADLPPEDLQHCRPSPKGLQHCRSSPFHCRSSPGEDLQHCRPSPIFVKFRILIFRHIEIKDFKS